MRAPAWHLAFARPGRLAALAVMAAAAAVPAPAASLADDGPVSSYLQAARWVTSELCPKLYSKPPGATDREILERAGLTVGTAPFSLLRLPLGAGGEIVFGTQMSIGLTPDRRWREGNSCTVALSSPYRDATVAAITGQLLEDGFVFDRQTLMGPTYKKKVGKGFQTVDVKLTDDGMFYNFVSDRAQPVAAFTFIY